MKKIDAQKYINEILAFANGKTIEHKSVSSGVWYEDENPSFACHLEYRIKSEPKLVPFTFEDELLGRKIIYSDGTRAMITAQKKDGVYIGGSLNLTSYSSLISTTKFEDGSPCGKYINE